MDRIESFPVACSGGLVTNLPQLAQSNQFPGSARELENFEPSVEGGYRRINGYIKYSTVPIPAIPPAYTQQAYSIGATSMVIGNWNFLAGLFYSAGATFKVPNDTTTYTVVSFTSAGYYSDTHGTLAFSPALSANVAARAKLEFTANPSSSDNYPVITLSDISFAYVFGKYNNIYRFQQNSGYVPLYLFNSNTFGTSNIFAKVNGGGQTGSTLAIKDLLSVPRPGDTFWIGASNGTTPETYVVTSGSYVLSSGTCTVNIYPSLPASPSDNAPVYWISRYSVQNFSAYSFTKYVNGVAVTNLTDEPYVLFGQGYYRPVSDLYDRISPTFRTLYAVEYYKNHMFWGSDVGLYFSAPYNEYDYSPANGAGEITLNKAVVGLKALRDSLIIFCRDSIYRITGSSAENFNLEIVTENTGCVDGRSIQEINGDVMFLSDTGLSRLADTDQQSGLGLSVVSNTIKTEIKTLLAGGLPAADSYYPSIFIPSLGQYRIFKDNTSVAVADSFGIIAAQVSLNPSEIQWSTLKGMKVSDVYHDSIADITVFTARGTGITARYIYLMNSGNTFDGTNITATYSTPYYTFNDPKMRKNFLKLTLTVEPEGNVTTTVDTLLNYNKSDVIQPPSVVLGTTSSTYGDTTSPSYETLLIGNGESMSLKFVSNTNIPPYVIQSFTIEYSTNDRR